MIRNLQQNDYILSLKNQVMHLMIKILKSQASASELLAIAYHFLYYLASSSILFQDEPFEPKESNQLFKIFLIQDVVQLTGVDAKFFLIAIIAAEFILIVLVGINFFKLIAQHTIIILSYLCPLIQIFSLLLFFYTIENLQVLLTSTQTNPIYSLLRVILTMKTIIILIFVCIYTYFCVRPFRNGNILWSYNNTQQFYHFLFCYAKGTIIKLDGKSLYLLILFLFIQFSFFQHAQTYLVRKIQSIHKCKHMLILLLHISLILGHIFQNKSLCFVSFCLTFVFCIIFYSLQYLSLAEQSEQIPRCCVQSSYEMYSFYIHFRNLNKRTADDLMKRLIVHFLICEQKDCIFKEGWQGSNLTKMTSQDLQQKISKLLKRYRYKDPSLELLYEIWKIQINKSITLTLALRDFTTLNSFIVQYALGLDTSKKEYESTVSENNNKLSKQQVNYKWKFYKQLNNAAVEFFKIGEVLCKPLPELNEIIDVVIAIHSQTQGLINLFNDMIRKKEVNYVCIELYLKFFACFINQNILSTDLLDRLKRIRVLVDSDFIQENPLPCFIIQSYTKVIQKVNAEGLKFMKAHRYQIKNKSLNTMIIPSLNLKDLHAYQKNSKDGFIPIFFKIKSANSTSMVCRNIQLKPLQINNKNYFQITVYKKINSLSALQMLIDESQMIIASTSQMIVLPFRQGKVQFAVQELYNQRIKPLLTEVSQLRIGRIQFGQLCYVEGMIVQRSCPYQNMKLIGLNLIKKVTQTRNNKRTSNARLSRLYSHGMFNFHYKYDEKENIVLEGSKTETVNPIKQNILDDNFHMTMRTLNEKLGNYISDLSNNRMKSFSSGIKVYRLFKGDLYNIDLENREVYQQQFEGLEQAFKQNSLNLKSFEVNENLLILILIVLVLFLTGSNIYMGVNIQAQLSNLKLRQIQMIQIEEFSLNYNRILALLRDVSNGLFSLYKQDFRTQIFDSYNEIQKIDSSNFLSDKIYTGVYIQEEYQGTLSQLIEVSLTHVYQFIQLLKNQIIENIHYYALIYLGPRLEEEKQMKTVLINEAFKRIKSLSMICYIMVMGGSFFYLLLFLTISKKFKMKINILLEPLLMKSETQVRRISEEAQKFKNIIGSLYKNYEVDLDLIEEKKQVHKRRIKAKVTNFGLSTIMFQLIFGSLLVLSLIAVATLGFVTLGNNTDRINRISSQGSAIIDSYSGLSWVTNYGDHLGKFQAHQIRTLSDKMKVIENSKNSLQFSASLSADIKTIFFNDSCLFLVKKLVIEEKWCSDFMKGFSIQNPFELSLDLYFRRMIYYVMTNVSDTYASNGLYSEPFKKVFKYLSEQIKDETIQLILDIRTTFLTISITACIISFFLISLFGISVCYYKKKVETISNGLATIIGDQNDKKTEINVEALKEENQDENSAHENLQESDALIAKSQDVEDRIREQ